METPIIKTKKGISPIWILPIVALLIGGWLLYKDFQESGIMITVRIQDASGLTAGKTAVMFKGLPVGTLKSFHITPDLLSIDAEIEMVKQSRAKLTKNTQFWVVRPEVSLNRIAGLDTLISGSYFEILPGTPDQELATFFTALDEIPPLSSHALGLHLTLTSQQATSLRSGSPVYYKKIEVGEIVSHSLQKDDSLKTNILIYTEFIDHVTSSSRFFINSGIQLKANLSEISIQIDPIKTLIQGGISFITPPNGKKIKDPAPPFPLYQTIEAATHANDIKIHLTFSVNHGLKSGSAIHYNGIKIGSVTEAEIDADMETVHAKAYIHKSLRRLLKVDTYIWPVEASLTAEGLSNLSTLIKGTHLNLIPGDGKPATTFKIHDRRPANIRVKGGLNIIMETERLGSLGYDKPVYYRQVRVGHTTGYELSATGQHVIIYVNIHEPYMNLIRENTKFWNTSGLRIKGGLMTEMKISTESLAAIIGGGLSFSTPNTKDMGKRIKDGHHFTLHNDPKDKWLHWSPPLELGPIPAMVNQKIADRKPSD